MIVLAATVLLALLLEPLLPLGLSEATAWLVQPATMHGRAGMDELMGQTRALLAFAEDKPTDVFGQQLSFNLLATGADTLVTTVVCTVTLSILAHGLTANPFANAYAARAATDPKMRA